MRKTTKRNKLLENVGSTTTQAYHSKKILENDIIGISYDNIDDACNTNTSTTDTIDTINTINNINNKDCNFQSDYRYQIQNMYECQESYQEQEQEYQLILSSDEIEDRILNEKNIPITAEYVNGIFKRFNFDHTVQNLENFQRAMIHSSYLASSVSNPKTIKLIKDIPPIDPKLKKKCMPLQTKSYERLEYLGDSALRHAIGKYLYLRYPDEEEGFLTTNRSKMENKFALSILARRLGMQNYAVIARNIELANGRTTYVTLTEDIFEAFIGAVNSELDENRTMEFIWALIEKEGDIAETIRTQNNYKDQLMQYFHKVDIVKHDLQYDDEELETDDGRRRFRTVVIDKNTQKRLGIGSGRSKKTSQQRAAKDALIKIGLIGNDVETIEYFDTTSIADINGELDKVRSHVIDVADISDNNDNFNDKKNDTKKNDIKKNDTKKNDTKKNDTNKSEKSKHMKNIQKQKKDCNYLL